MHVLNIDTNIRKKAQNNHMYYIFKSSVISKAIFLYIPGRIHLQKELLYWTALKRHTRVCFLLTWMGSIIFIDTHVMYWYLLFLLEGMKGEEPSNDHQESTCVICLMQMSLSILQLVLLGTIWNKKCTVLKLDPVIIFK